MKKYILIIIISFLSACTTEGMLNVFKGTGLVVTNQSTDWELIPNSFGSVSPLEFRNKTYPEIVVQMEIGATLYGDVLTEYNCKRKIENKHNSYGISFYIISDGKKATKERIYLNPTKYYFVKNKNEFNIKISKILLIFSRVKWTDYYYNLTEFFKIKSKICIEYDSPLICGELENAEMIFDGFVVNDTPLPPIKVHLKYKDPQSIPLYSSEKK